MFIDRLTIFHYKGSLLESKRYYAYGLPVDAATALTPTYPENRYLYQTKKQEKVNGLYMQDFHARQYDPQLGRFAGIDPAGQFSSGYIGMGNAPSVGTDPDGRFVGGFARTLFWGGVGFWVGGVHGFFSKSGSLGERFKNGGQQGWKKYSNAWKIYAGRFNSDKKGFRAIADVWSKNYWQGLQTRIGQNYMQIANTFGNVDIEYFHGATVVYGAAMPDLGITIGPYIGLGGRDRNTKGESELVIGDAGYTTMHEYGHYLQSKKNGPFYLFKFGLTSLLGKNTYWTEHDANYRAAHYFHNVDPTFSWESTSSHYRYLPDREHNFTLWDMILGPWSTLINFDKPR